MVVIRRELPRTSCAGPGSQARRIRIHEDSPLIALTCVLTLEDPRRFRKSRDVGVLCGVTAGTAELGTEPNVIELPPSHHAPLLIVMDFNVHPMTALVGQRAGGQCHIIDEIVLPNSNMQEMSTRLTVAMADAKGSCIPI